MQIDIDDAVASELAHLVRLHQQYGAPNPQPTVERLVGYVLASIADGSRRPGSWERQLLEALGLVADCAEHQVYRARYGALDGAEEVSDG